MTVASGDSRSRRWMLVASALGVAAIVALALVARSGSASAKTSKVAATAPAEAATITETPHPPKEILPPGYERYKPAGPPEMIDPQVEWANAQELALKRFPDARVSELYASHVRLDGTVDLTTGGLVSADFGLKTAFEAADASWGLKVALQGAGSYASTLEGGSTTAIERLVPWPRCTVREIMKRATTALPAGGVAMVQYLHDAFRTRWLVRMGSVDLQFKDDCRK